MMKEEIDKKIVKDEDGMWKDSELKAPPEKTEPELKLEMLSKAINSDFEWAMNSSLIFENHGVEDPETKGFLKGVAYCTEMYLDILEREGIKII